MFRGLGGHPGGPGGRLGDPMRPTRRFDGSSDDSLGILADMKYVIQIFFADERTDGQAGPG